VGLCEVVVVGLGVEVAVSDAGTVSVGEALGVNVLVGDAVLDTDAVAVSVEVGVIVTVQLG